MKKLITLASGAVLASGLLLAPNAIAAEDGAAEKDAAAECRDGEGDETALGESGESVDHTGILSVEGDPTAPETAAVGEIVVCIDGTQGNADGAARVGGSSEDGELYVIADGNGDNREQTRGYIGAEVSADAESGEAEVTPVGDGDNCNYGDHGTSGDAEEPDYNSHGNGSEIDAAGLQAFASGESNDGGTCPSGSAG